MHNQYIGGSASISGTLSGPVQSSLTSRLDALVGRLASLTSTARQVDERLTGMGESQAVGIAQDGRAGIPTAEESVQHAHKLCDVLDERLNRIASFVG